MDINITSAWDLLKSKIQACRKCELCKERNNVVVGSGPVENCRCVIIGEAPGEEEDRQGLPFVGRAGQLLTDILQKGAGIDRKLIYITNVVKCRPPGNRDPKSNELLACNEFLEAQLLLLQPSIIVTMGRISAKWLIKAAPGIMKIRGQWQKWRGLDLLPMYHPSFLLRREAEGDLAPKRDTWRDVIALKVKLDELSKINN